MKYHICKKSRLYTGRPYCGPSSDNTPAEADNIESARELVRKLTSKNLIGWDIYDSETKEVVN